MASQPPSSWVLVSDEFSLNDSPEPSQDTAVVKAALLQPQPSLLPPQRLAPRTPLPSAAREIPANLFGVGAFGRTALGRPSWVGIRRAGTEVVFGFEATTRATTDAGNLLGKSPSVLGVGIQKRTPIVNDPRIRGSRVGQLAASGSYWVPARIDLDTMLSKIDSRIIDDIIVIKGPYSALHGPGLSFVDAELLLSPRYHDGPQSHGSSSFDFKTNGEQWYGRQSFWGGAENYGFRVGYGHRTGNDYSTGAGIGIPSSYNSRDMDLAFGRDFSPDSSLEFNYLRLDQTNVEYPGMAFDMDFLVTDGLELQYEIENQECFDRFVVETWYNRTQFEGNAQREGKRRQFPFLDFIRYVGFTDVDSASSGFRAAATWGDDESANLTAGADLRYLKQELNEISSGRIGFTIWDNANSPLPRSQWSNPGLFLEHGFPLSERLVVRAGARVDFAGTQVIDDPAKLARLGNQPPARQSSLADILGTDQFNRDFAVWSAFLSGEYEVNSHWNLVAAMGHGERPPSLTELYVAESFLFLLQNGMNITTGDPRLRPERVWQMDLGLEGNYGCFRGGAHGFYAWIQDYITFENLNVVTGPPANQVEQVSLKYVNTDLATLAGFELYAEYNASRWMTPFATLKYLEGQDRTRNGRFATRRVTPGSPSERVSGVPRGFFSGVTGGSSEPLPGILPLESRLGIRLHPDSPQPRWSIELAARVVTDQNRVATSLLETPTPGFTVWDLRGYWRVRDGMLLVAGFENFTDKNYREHLDFRSERGIQVFQPGMNFYFGTELTY